MVNQDSTYLREFGSLCSPSELSNWDKITKFYIPPSVIGYEFSGKAKSYSKIHLAGWDLGH